MGNITTGKVLIIDDDLGVIHTMCRLVNKLLLKSDFSTNLSEGLDKIFHSHFDLVLLDVNLPDGSGLEAIENINSQHPDPPQIIILTAYSDADGAELAIKNGAWDYIRKPSSTEDIRLHINQAMEYRRQKKKAEQAVHFENDNIIGKSAAIKKCYRQAARISNSDGNVLITGETGTGKELFAKAIHANSPRSRGEFIVVDCSVLSENLIESVLFGHEKGAFTGADRSRQGLIALANGGTLFLDEVGELPLMIQSSFLRVLQEKRFRPIGSEKEFFSNFRVICATNKKLEEMVRQDLFRSDLIYRLEMHSMQLPPLRERKEDILLIADNQIKKCCNAYKIPEKMMSPDFIEALQAYDWPGNVRELINAIETSVTAAQHAQMLFAFHIPSKIRACITRSKIEKTGILNREDNPEETLNALVSMTHKSFIQKMEKQYLESIFTDTNGNIQEQIQKTGLSRSALYRKLKQHQIH